MADNPARILYVCNDLTYFNWHRRALAEDMAARGHAVRVLVDPAGGAIAPDDALELRAVRVVRHGLSPWHDPRFAARVMATIRAFRPDVVHTITIKPNLVAGLAACLMRAAGYGPRRIVLTVPGLGRLYDGGSGPSRARAAAEAGFRRIGRDRAVRVGFETDAHRELWIERGLIPAARSFVTAGAGLDLSRFSPAPREPDGITVLFAGRLLRAKGLEVFLRAAERLAAERTDIAFWIAGPLQPNDPDGITAEDLARVPAVRWLGQVDDMPGLLARVDSVCLPSRHEGVPRILIEAAACARVAIATDLPGCRVVIRHGETGLLLRERDTVPLTDELVAGFKRIAADPHALRAMGAAARAHIEAGGFSQEAVHEAYARAYFGDGE